MITKDKALECIAKAKAMEKGALYQPIILPYGVSLRTGHDKSFLLKYIFLSHVPSSFLDIGCNVGHLCFSVRTRSTGKIVGVEHNPQICEVASIVGEAWGFEVRQAELEKFVTKEKFDTVALISVLHHRITDPEGEIARYAKMATRAIILELPRSDEEGIAIKSGLKDSYWKWRFNIDGVAEYLKTLGFTSVITEVSPRKYHGNVPRYIVYGERV